MSVRPPLTVLPPADGIAELSGIAPDGELVLRLVRLLEGPEVCACGGAARGIFRTREGLRPLCGPKAAACSVRELVGLFVDAVPTGGLL